MTPERWQRISAVFAAAQALPSAERGVYLEAALAGHPEDRAEVDALLQRHASDSSWSAPPLAPASTDGPFELGRVIGRYRIVRRLKPGGMGILYVAEDNIHRQVVIKVLAPALAADPLQRERLRREAEAMARLQHPGIATVHAFEEADGLSYLVTEFVRGRDLRERLEAEGPLALRPLLDLAIGVTDALGAAHAAGVVHRDLKPENIMLPDTGGVKLVDFGIARFESVDAQTHATLTQTGGIVGTPAYLTPEQLRGGAVDHRCDLFAFGIVLYEAATGRHPFVGESTTSTMANILERTPPPLAVHGAVAPPQLETIVATCLKKQPDQRYQSAAELLRELSAARSLLGGTARTHSSDVVVPPPPKQSPRWWWQVHQVTVGLVYWLLLIPLWLARERLAPGTPRDVLFFVAVPAVVVSSVLRFNAAFSARFWPDAMAATIRRRRWVFLLVDVGLAALLAAGAFLVQPTKPGLAAVLLAGAIGVVATLLVVEPATTKMAFPSAPPP